MEHFRTFSGSLILSFIKRDWRGAVLPLLFILVWAGITAQGWVNTKLIVPPVNVVKVAYQTLTHADFYVGLSISLWRDGVGFLIGGVAGIVLGALMGVSRWANRIVGPTFHTLKHISLFAWLPLISTWMGQGDVAKIIFIALSAFYPVALGTLEGVQRIAKAQVEVAKVYAFNRTQFFFKLVLPAASPQILAGLHLGLIAAWLATIGSEYLLAKSGLGIGDTVIKGKAAFNVELIIVGVLVIGLVGTVLNRLASSVEHQLLHWRNG
ncbi:MAG: ABC transporter permease [Pseudomonadota bacterium]